MGLSEHATGNASGVYAIRHLLSGKCYVGSAKNMRRRWGRHRADLVAGSHHSVKLQRAWNISPEHIAKIVQTKKLRFEQRKAEKA